MDRSNLLSSNLLDNILKRSDDSLSSATTSEGMKISQEVRADANLEEKNSSPQSQKSEPRSAKKDNDNIPSNKRYFVMKSLNSKNLETALECGIWATQVHNESKLNDAYKVSWIMAHKQRGLILF